jgi:hypothetical protein
LLQGVEAAELALSNYALVVSRTPAKLDIDGQYIVNRETRWQDMINEYSNLIR